MLAPWVPSDISTLQRWQVGKPFPLISELFWKSPVENLPIGKIENSSPETPANQRAFSISPSIFLDRNHENQGMGPAHQLEFLLPAFKNRVCLILTYPLGKE